MTPSPASPMRYSSAFVVLSALLLNLAAAASAQTRVVRAGKVWDGVAVLTDVAIVIEGDRISRIVPANAELPSGGEMLDLRKYTLLPGLIDLHTHMVWMEQEL